MAALPPGRHGGPDPERSNNAAIIFITPTNRVLLVRSSGSGKWGVPGGKRERRESDFECALREFREETGFVINPVEFTSPVISRIRFHRNGSKTNIFIIRSSQRFPDFDPKLGDGEIEALHYLDLDDLRRVVDGVPHRIVTKLRDSNISSLIDLFKNGDL